MTLHTEQFIKVLNATEAGETNTNDSYVLVPKKYDARRFFGDDLVRFKARVNGFSDCTVELRYELARGSEQRIYQLGAFCREYNIHSGDVVCIEKRVVNHGSPTFVICGRRKSNVIFIQKSHDHYIIMRNDMGMNYLDVPHEINTPTGKRFLAFEYVGDFSKRKDSPDKIPHYDVKLGCAQIDAFISTSYVEIDCNNNSINSVEPFKHYAVDQD